MSIRKSTYPPTFPDATSTLALRLTTIASAANYLQVTTKTIREYVSAGLLTGYRVGPRMVRLDVAEVEALIRAIPTVERESA